MPLTSSNPFAQRSTLPYELPPFAQITEDHYLPAFYAGTEEQLAEVEAIINNPEPPTFENTIVALEKSGGVLTRMLMVFFNKSSSDTNDRIQAIEEEIAPKLAAHEDAIRLNPALFSKIKALYDARETLGLDADDAHLLDRYYRDFVHAGAHLDEAQREQLKKYNEELANLDTQFAKNLLADTNDLAVVVRTLRNLMA